jgi:hypothetical protein
MYFFLRLQPPVLSVLYGGERAAPIAQPALCVIALMLAGAAAVRAQPAPQTPHSAEHHEYVIENFRTDLYFPVGDARFEAQFISRVSLVPIPSLWGHPAGAGGNPTDRAFLNETIARFLAGEQVGR